MAAVENVAEPIARNRKEEDAGIYAMHLALLYSVPQVLKAAIDLNLLDLIAEEAATGKLLSAAEIAAKLPTKNPEAAAMIDRILRMLGSYSLLQHSLWNAENGKVERVYGISPAGKFFVKSQEDGSLASLLPLGCHPVTWEVGCHLKDMAIEGGDLYEKLHKMLIFEYMNKSLTLNKIFNAAMADISIIIMKKILDTYQGFSDLKMLVDVGKGIGASLNMIVSEYPYIRGINFDLPCVVKHAPSYSGIEHIGGDMFACVPKAEALMTKCTLHNWSDKQCLTILKNCYEALPKKGKLIVMDFVSPVELKGSYTDKMMFGFDNVMMMHQGGQERTVKDLETLCRSSGFSDFKFICYTHIVGCMECYK